MSNRYCHELRCHNLSPCPEHKAASQQLQGVIDGNADERRMPFTGSREESKRDPEERVTQWLNAAHDGNHELVALLLRESPELVNAEDGVIALHCAVINAHPQAVELLLAANPLLVHGADAQGRTALHIAVENNNFLIVEQLLGAGPCVDLIKAVDSDGKTALDYAKGGSWESVARILVEDPTLADQAFPYELKTALHYAARYGYYKGVTRLLREHPDMINPVDRYGSTVLHETAHFGQPEMMSLLLAVASPELINAVNEFDQNALHAAGHPEIAAQLLAASPELIHGVDNQGQTVLHRAAACGWVDFAAKLLAAKPELIDQVDNQGRTALCDAIAWGYQAMVEMLLAAKPELIHAVDNLGFTVLHVVAEKTKNLLPEECIANLLTLIPNALHVVNNRGQTPFAVAVEARSYAAIRVMQPKLMFDEVVNAFEEWELGYKARVELLRPVLSEQCGGCLLDLLNQDVVYFVYEYLGFELKNNVIVSMLVE